MRAARIFLPLLIALSVAGCMNRDGPAPFDSSAAYAPAPADRGFFGAFGSNPGEPASPPVKSSVLQYRPPQSHDEVVYRAVPPSPAPPPAAAYSELVQVAAAPAQQPYRLDSGDKLRVVVYGQEGITGSYTVDASGNVSLPLAGTVPARGRGTQALASAIAGRLKQGYVRDPHVSVEVETYRPFFILGEVTTPGQYPFVPNMTVEKAIAIAGGFAPRAYKDDVEVTHGAAGQQVRQDVPLSYPLQPGDTVKVKERWF